MTMETPQKNMFMAFEPNLSLVNTELNNIA